MGEDQARSPDLQEITNKTRRDLISEMQSKPAIVRAAYVMVLNELDRMEAGSYRADALVRGVIAVQQIGGDAFQMALMREALQGAREQGDRMDAEAQDVAQDSPQEPAGGP
jgi:hypothetical protein